MTVFIKASSRSFIVFRSGIGADGLAEGEIEADGDWEGLSLGETLGFTEGLADGDALGEADGLTDADGD